MPRSKKIDPVSEFEIHLVDPTKPELCLAMSTTTHAIDDSRTRPWSPWESLAARQGQTIIYDTTDRLDVCPHLRSRIERSCSAVCVPLLVMGRILGVMYAVSDAGVRSSDTVERIESVARRAGLHIGLVRAASKSEVATVDQVTGLPDQRAAREHLTQLTQAGTPYTLALVDIDHFALYRERNGTDAANEALRLLAESLVNAVRPTDIVARVGDFEFAVVLPDATSDSTLKAVERVREELIITQAVRPKPLFTCSFGVSHSTMSPTIEGVISLAAGALDDARNARAATGSCSRAPRIHGHPAGSGDLN